MAEQPSLPPHRTILKMVGLAHGEEQPSNLEPMQIRGSIGIDKIGSHLNQPPGKE